MARASSLILVAFFFSIPVRSQEFAVPYATAQAGSTTFGSADTALVGRSGQPVEVKKQALALAFSMAIPGLGQVYNGQVDKAIVFAGLFWGGVYMVDQAKITREHESITAFGWLSVAYVAGVYAWNLLDAPLSAKRINEAANSGLSVGPTILQAPGGYSGGVQLTLRF